MAKKIKVTVKGADTVDYKNISDFQDELKVISEDDLVRLKNEIIEYGFNSPIHVWKQGNALHNLDGHQRVHALRALESEGYEIPPVPVDYVEAKSKRQAKHILLSRVSQYGKTTPQGLYAFMADANMPMDEVKESFSIPDMDVGKFEKEYFPVVQTVDPEEAFANLKDGDQDGLQQITFTMTQNQKEVVTAAVSKALGMLKNQSGGKMGPNKNGNAIYYICSQFV